MQLESKSRERFLPGLLKIKNKVGLRDLFLFASVLMVSAAASFLYQQPEEGLKSLELQGEVNSSNSIQKINFHNETASIMLEEGEKAEFYIDLDSDGSADIKLEGLVRDGNARKDSRILDYRSGAYLLKFRYSDNSSKTDDAWLSVSSITLLG
ncbi:MAG: hypothetical protein ABEK10_02005 [Candidatus Nanosalina sp.]